MKKDNTLLIAISILFILSSCSKSDEQTPVPTPSILSQSICEGETMSDLIVDSGTNIKWYLNPKGGTFLANNYTPVSGNYYCTQTRNGIESLRAEAEITVVQCVTIGAQTWMKKNLDVDHYRNGDPIPEEVYPTYWISPYPIYGLSCQYHNDPNYGAKYGKLYNFYTVLDPRKLAPRGFHIPNHEEWDILFNSIGGIDAGSDALRETTGWTGSSTTATNSTGFSALPGGFRSSLDGEYVYEGGGGYWWSYKNNGGNYNEFVRMYSGNVNSLAWSDLNIRCGLSVRCVRD